MWKWFDRAVMALQARADDGTLFLEPWTWLYRLLAFLFGAVAVVFPLATLSAGITATYALHQSDMHPASVQTLSTTLLLAIAWCIVGMLAARLMWGRSNSLRRYQGTGGRFIIGPLMADLLRSLGEMGGIVAAVSGVLFFMALWPAEQAILQLPLVGDFMGQYIGFSPWYPVLGVLTGFGQLLLTRWIADYLEVFFAMANDMRGLRNGSAPERTVYPVADPAGTSMVVNWRMVGLVVLGYLTVAMPLHHGLPLIPAALLLLFCGLRTWWPGASLLLSFVLLLGIGVLTDWIGNSYPDSLVAHFHWAWLELLLGLFIIGLVAIVVVLSELLSKPPDGWVAQYGKVTVPVLLIIFLAFPIWSTWKEFSIRHTLTNEELTAARDLFKEYQDRQYVMHVGTRVDTVNLLRIEPASFQADKYGKITFNHTIVAYGVPRNAQFERSYRSIRIPDSVQYKSQHGDWSIRYLEDSLVFRDGRQASMWHAVPLDKIRERTYGASRRLRSEALRDSLHQVRDTLQGVFRTYNCDNPPCFAWFEVEQEGGGSKRMAFYCRGSVVSSYPLNSIPADDSKWRLKVRKTIVDNADPNEEGSIVLELVGLDPLADVLPEPVEPTREEVGTSIPKPNPNATFSPSKPAVEKRERTEKKPLRKEEVDIEPTFVGGRTGLDRYIRSNKRYPPEDFAAGRTGKVRVAFVIEKGGTVRDVRVVRSVSQGLDAEAMRLIREMPKWAPGSKGGVAVDVSMEWTVDFSLND